MPRICYREKNFRFETLEIISTANEIIVEYANQGYLLTLRQLYYQFVARALIPNTEQSYNRIGSIINDARMAGLIDWKSIEDRTRWLREKSHWSSPAEIIRTCVDQYHVDMWENQNFRPEVWIEKDALVGVIEGVCTEFDVPFFACRGYVSQSEQWRAGRRFKRYFSEGQAPVVFHLGDHDPSGIDMTRDNTDRLAMFCGKWGVGNLRRLALNMDQVEKYDPPPNPAKLSDSRAHGYITKYGDDSWELDALEPAVISELIRKNIQDLIDPDAWEEAKKLKEDGVEILEGLAEELEQ